MYKQTNKQTKTPNPREEKRLDWNNRKVVFGSTCSSRGLPSELQKKIYFFTVKSLYYKLGIRC